MGTHPSGPSLVSLQAPLRSLTPLADMLHLNPALAGERRYHTSPTSGLPYLFKILSVRTALSIQVRVRVRARVRVSLQDTLGPQGSLDTGATRQGLSLSLTLTLTLTFTLTLTLTLHPSPYPYP